MERENVFMLPEDFFERDEVIQIEALQGGTTFLNILLKLHAKFYGNNGRIAAGDAEASAEQTLSLIASVTRNNLICTRMAVDLFLDRGFMEERDGFLYLTEIPLCTEGKKGGAENGR
ncbi:MAG: phage replisome organizer N-terminal domain-containing protein [Acetatifactor muris]|nr:phage replisome organizer N-terminal domain-containing protein [Acetatifactor muris]